MTRPREQPHATQHAQKTWDGLDSLDAQDSPANMNTADRPYTERLRPEEAWLRDGLARAHNGARSYALWAILLVVLSGAYSWFFGGDEFYSLAPIRVAMAGALALLVAALRLPIGERYPRHLALGLMLIAAIGVSALALESGGQASPQHQRIPYILYGSALLITWSGWWSLAGSSIVLAVFVVTSAAAGQLTDDAFMGNAGRLAAATLVTVAITIARERYRWREVWHEHAASAAHRRADAEIIRLNEQLEERVRERTAELHASEQRVRALVDAAPIGIVAADASGVILETNTAFAEMLGRDIAQIIGTSIQEHTSPDDRDASWAAYEALVDGRSNTFTAEKRYTRESGDELNAHAVVAAVRTETGEFNYALAMIEDVSDRVRAESYARDQENRLAHVLRVSALGEMATELAHEINQPLGAIVNFANGTVTRLRQSGADDELVKSVSRISSEAWRAAEILRRMHGFVQPRETLCENTNINDLVDDVAILVAGDVRRSGATLTLDRAAELPSIDVDPIRIEQVILNLVRNAIDAVRDNPRGARELKVETSFDAACIEVVVRDSGAGISMEGRERMFDAFYTTKSNGLGMGLSISRTIVETYDGRVWVEDNDGPGVSVGFTLPFRDAIAVEA